MRMIDATFLVGRFLFGGFFVFSAMSHLFNTAMLSGYAALKGVPLPQVAVFGTGLLLLIGGVCVILGLAPRLGLVALIVFLLGVTPIMHDFWAIADPIQRANEMGNFLKNTALLGACCAMMAIPVPWLYGVGHGLLLRRTAARPEA